MPDPHHPLTHHGGKPDWIERVTLINTHHVELFAYVIRQLKVTPDGDGTLLDRCMVVYGSGIADGDRHSHENLPVLSWGEATAPSTRTPHHLLGRYADDQHVPHAARSARHSRGHPRRPHREGSSSSGTSGDGCRRTCSDSPLLSRRWSLACSWIPSGATRPSGPHQRREETYTCHSRAHRASRLSPSGPVRAAIHCRTEPIVPPDPNERDRDEDDIPDTPGIESPPVPIRDPQPEGAPDGPYIA